MKFTLNAQVVQGIPNTLRGLIWAELTDACEIIKKNSAIYQVRIRDAVLNLDVQIYPSFE